MTEQERFYFNKKFDSVEDKISEVSARTLKLETIVTGNSGVGHEQRITDVEEWRKNHPNQCPYVIKKSQIFLRRSVDAAIIGIVVSVILFIVERIL